MCLTGRPERVSVRTSRWIDRTAAIDRTKETTMYDHSGLRRSAQQKAREARKAGRASALALGALAGAGGLTLAASPAGAASLPAAGATAAFNLGVLTVQGTAQDDTIQISRDAAGTI